MGKYYNNNKVFYKKTKKFPRNVYFDIEQGATDGGKLSLQETWHELREALKNNQIKYNELEKIKETRFIKVLNEILNQEGTKSKVTVELQFYTKSKTFLRAAILKPGEIATKERFVPRADKMKSSNRFSPKGFEWLYLGFGRYENDVRKCCLAEIRSKSDDIVKFCKFKYNGGNYRVIDLTIADKMNWDDICNKKVKTPEETISLFVLEVYCKLLSEEIFVPVDTKNKDIEYAPFHCMAQYFKSLGYNGIIYKSTVSEYGRNMVLFDKNMFSPEEIW